MSTIQSGIATNNLNTPIGKNLATISRTLNPSDGSLAYDETTQLVYYGKNLVWNSLSTGGGGGTPIPPSQAKIVYVTKYGDDTTGDGSSLKPYVTISKAIDTANLLSTSSNPINIQISPGLYIENNAGGPITVTADGVSIVGTSNLAVFILPSTTSQVLLMLNKTARISDVTFQSSAALSTALILNDGFLSAFRNVRFINFSLGVSCLGTSNTSYTFAKCGFIANLSAISVNNVIAKFDSCDISGTTSIALPPANIGISISGSASSVIYSGGLIGLCSTAMIVSNNARCAVNSSIFRRNKTDLSQTLSSNVNLSACDFQLTGGSSFVCFDSSDPGTITEIIGCSFDARNLLGVGGQGVCVSSKNEANVLISGGTINYFDKAIIVGTNSDTSTTKVNVFSLIINNCTTDILQQGTSTLGVNSCSLSSNKLVINDSTNVTLAYFDLSSNNSLYIGSDSNADTSLVHASLGGSNHIGFHYQPNIYGAQSISSINTTTNPTALLSVGGDNSSIQSVTTDRTKASKLSLYSDEGVQVGTTVALRGWDLQKNGNTSELNFNYINTDLIGQIGIPQHTVFQLDGLNNVVSLPTVNTKLVFGSDTNLYRSSSNVLKTDDNFIIAPLTPGKIVATDSLTNELISSVVSNTELGYLSGVTSPIQTQLNNKVSRSGDTMTGSLTLPDGSALAPSLTFSGSSDTGLFQNMDNLSITTNGVERLKVASDGVVSIKGFTIPGVVHNDSFGNLTTSQIVDSDISIIANILDTKLATISTSGKVLNSATSASDLNLPNSIVSRNILGDFSANVITANFIGNLTGSASSNVLKAGDTMSGALTLPAGLLASPSLKFTGSTNTGITAASANVLSLISNGVEKAKVDSSGLTVTNLTSTGVVHNNASGLLSTSLIVNSDITNGTIANTKLSTISSSNTSGYIVVRDGFGNFSTNQISIDGPVINPTDAATKSYVDTVVSTGLVAKTPALVVSTSNTVLTGLQTIDSVSLSALDRVLLTNQSTTTENGLWEVQVGVWTRSSDFNTGSTADQAYVLIISGFNNTGTSWLCNTPTAVIDTDPIGFELFSLPNVTTGTNVGAGVGQVFKNKTGIFLNFKTLLNGSHTQITNNTDDITISTDAVSTNTINTIVSRDGSGNFSANTITANLTGTASNNVAKSGDTMSGILNMLTQNSIRFQDLSGGEYVGIKAPTAVPSSYTLELPTSIPTIGQSLRAGSVTATRLEWVTESGSLSPFVNRVIYVSKNGDDITGTGSYNSPYASLDKAIQTANILSSASNPININVSAGLYIEDNSLGPFVITSEGISVTGESSNSTIFTINTPFVDFLVSNQTCNVSNLTFVSAAPLARGIVLTSGIESVVNNLKISGFLTGIEFSGITSSYACGNCIFSNNGTAVFINDTVTEFTGCTFIGNSSIYDPPANTALLITGSNAVGVMTGGSCVLCTNGFDVQNNSLLTASSVVFKLNTYDIVQKGASHMTLLSCTFAITTFNSDVDIQISEPGTYAEIIGCQFNGKDIVSIAGGTAIHLFDGARLDINGGDIKNYDLALRVGIPTDTSTTQMFATAIGIHECILDLVQEGQSQLTFNTCTSAKSKIQINDNLYVKLAYFDVDEDNTLTIEGNSASAQLDLLEVSGFGDSPTFSFRKSFYSTRGLGYSNTLTNTLFSISEQNDSNTTTVTGSRNKNASINLLSDTSSPIGDNTSAIRGWSITKNGSSAELIFNYQNTDIIGQSAIPSFSIFELDGVNNKITLPDVNSKLYFESDTNLYRSSANLLKTDGGMIIGSLTPNRIVTTNVSNVLTSSITTDTELGYLSGVTSSIQTQLNNKVSRSGDTMTGALTLISGTTGSPSLLFTGSTNTGLSAASNNLSFSTNGVERMKISSSGTVSINGFSVAGIVHNDALGNLTTSLITNADIIAGANISDSKLATISTAGKVSNSATTATNLNTPNTIVLRDASGNFSAGTITANLNGNAATATTATTAASTVNFSGSLLGDVTGTQSATVVSLVGGQSATNIAAATVLANAATNLNTVSTIVKRDASGNFSAGTITASFIGNLTGTATNFSGSLNGDVTGTQSTTVVSFVGGQSSSNVSAATILANSATNLNTVSTIVKRDASGNFSAGNITATLIGSATNFSGSLLGDVTGTQSSTVVSLIGGQSATNVASATLLANAATNLNTASTIVKRDSSGNFTAGVITANLIGNVTGNATTSTNFSGSLLGDVTGTQSATVVSFIGGQSATNVATATVLANNATNLNTASAIVKRDASGNFTAGTITATFIGNLTGNASTATSTINFSGSLLGDVTGTQSATVVSFVGGQSAINIASTVTTVNDATNLNTVSTIVKRDASGNFSAGTITATFVGNLTGNATSTTNFSGSLLGDVTGTQSATVVSFVGGQSSTNVALATIAANTATDLNTPSTIVERDASGNFAGNTITANLFVGTFSGSFTGSASLNVLKSGDTMSGSLILPAGTAASPSLKFTGSTNTGLSAPTANKLSFDSNGIEMMSIDSTNIIMTGKHITTNVIADQAFLVITANANNGTATALAGTSIMLLKNNVSRTGWTFVFPPSPINGQMFNISLIGSASITFVNTGGTGGATIVNGVTSITITAPCVKYVYYSIDNTWCRIG